MEMMPLIGMFSILIFFLVLGIPIAFAFGLANLLAVVLFVGVNYIPIVISDCFESLSNFLYIAFPLFILMGELFHYSGIAEVLVGTLAKWLRWLPGSLGITTTIGSAIFGALSGSSMATCAAMGTATIPGLIKDGYSKETATGLIAFGGVLDIFIPPSAIVVIYAGLTQGPVGKLLIGGVTPGVFLTVLGCVYIALSHQRQRSASDRDRNEEPKINYRELIANTVKYFLPLSFVIFAVTVTIYLGIATPSEAAAVGCVTSAVLIVAYRRFSFSMLKAALFDSMNATSMVFLIITGSTAFSHLLFLTGSSQKVISLITGIHVPPLWIVVIMLIIVLILGCFIDVISIMFITLPIFSPLVEKLGYDKLWFGLVYLYCIAIGPLTPPFGVNLFVTKSVAPPDITLNQVYRGALPFVIISLVLFPLFLMFPRIIVWLPNLAFTK